MKISKTTGTTISVRIPGSELRQIIAQAVAAEAGIDLSTRGARVQRVEIRTERCADDVGDEPVAYVEIFIIQE